MARSDLERMILNMKKIFAVLGMAICMIGLTACGGHTDTTPVMSENSAIDTAEKDFLAINSIVSQNAEKKYKDDLVVTSAVKNLKTAIEECGQPNTTDITVTDTDINTETATVKMSIGCENRQMLVSVVLDSDGAVTELISNPVYTKMENMERAGLNTLIGMGMAFSVLILIRFVIALLPKFTGLVEGGKKKPAAKSSNEAMDNTIAQIEKNEEQSNDTEIAAVIAAAVAATEGSSTDAFVVRSIRRR